MASVSQVPGPLQQAIDTAAQQYGVPADILAGIWRVETGSTYPNPWANGLGYGGEFGTAVTAPFGAASQVKRIVEPPLQQQANTSASIFASTLRASGGAIAPALYAYSGHGYTSVPGETTFGNFSGGYQTPQASPPSAAIDTGSGTVSNASLTSGGLTGEVSGSIQEAILRLAELFAAAVLIYLGLKALQRALQADPTLGSLGQGAGAVGRGTKFALIGEGGNAEGAAVGILNAPAAILRDGVYVGQS